MKMLSFMRSHSMDEWAFAHTLLGVAILLSCIVSGIYSIMNVFNVFAGGNFLDLVISLSVLTVSGACFVYIDEGKKE